MMVSTSVLDDTKTKTALIAVLVAILFYFGIKLGHYLATPPDHIATFWPPNTIVLAALLLSDKRRWWIFILAITPVYIFGALQSGFSVPRTLIFYTANCTEVLVAAFVINYACQEKTINLNHFKDMVIFLLSAVLLAPVISACIASLTSFWLAWRVWFLGDAIAHLTLTPALILWFSFIAKARSFYTKPALGSLYFAELTVFIVLLITVSFIALGAEVGDTHNYPALLFFL